MHSPNNLFVPTPVSAGRFLMLWWRRGTTIRWAIHLEIVLYAFARSIASNREIAPLLGTRCSLSF